MHTGFYQCQLFNRSSLLLRADGMSHDTPEEGVEGLRVAQIATILFNLSCDSTAVQLLADHDGVLRYMYTHA